MHCSESMEKFFQYGRQSRNYIFFYYKYIQCRKVVVYCYASLPQLYLECASRKEQYTWSFKENMATFRLAPLA